MRSNICCACCATVENTQKCQVRFNPPVTPSKVITAEKMLWKRRKCKSHYFLKHKHDEIRLIFRSGSRYVPGNHWNFGPNRWTLTFTRVPINSCKTYYTRTSAVTHYRLTLSSIKHSKTHPSCCPVPAWMCLDLLWLTVTQQQPSKCHRISLNFDHLFQNGMFKTSNKNTV